MPGDPSQAAFWVVAACVVPDSVVTVETGLCRTGPARATLDVLARMGASIEERPATGPGDLAATADIVGPLRAAARDRGPGLGDHRPRRGPGAGRRGAHAPRVRTVFRDVGELRVKESDRLAGVAELVSIFGAEVTVDGDDLTVEGAGRLVPGVIDAHGDHRMAMAAAVAGLAAGERSHPHRRMGRGRHELPAASPPTWPR